MAATSSLIDNFDDNSQNTSIWDSYGTFSETGGQLTVTANSGSSNYGGYTSKTFYDLTGDSVSVNVADAGNQSLASWQAIPVYLYLDANNSISWYVNNGYIHAQKQVSGAYSDVKGDGVYNSTVHKYFRIRESGGTTYWDYSTDGYSWTNYTSESNPIAVTSLKIEIIAGTYSSELSSTTAKFDNLNIINTTVTPDVKALTLTTYAPLVLSGRPPLSTLIDTFPGSSLDAKWVGSSGSGSITVSGGNVTLTGPSAGAPSFDSASTYSLIASYFFNQIVSRTTEATTAYSVYIYQDISGNYRDIQYELLGTTLNAKYWNGSQQTAGSTTYNSSTMRFLRIRESSGTYYWDYSADAITWSNLASSAIGYSLNDATISISGGSTNATPRSIVLDDVNSIPYTYTPSTASLTITAYAPTINVSNNQLVTPGVKALTITTYAPTINVSNNQLVTPGVKALTLTTYVSSVVVGQLVTPGVKALTITTYVSTINVSNNQLVTPNLLNLIITRYNPSVVVGQLVTPGVKALTITTYSPVITIAVSVIVIPDTTTIVITNYSPQISITNYIPLKNPALWTNNIVKTNINWVGLQKQPTQYTNNITKQPTQYTNNITKQPTQYDPVDKSNTIWNDVT